MVGSATLLRPHQTHGRIFRRNAEGDHLRTVELLCRRLCPALQSGSHFLAPLRAVRKGVWNPTSCAEAWFLSRHPRFQTPFRTASELLLENRACHPRGRSPPGSTG